MAFQPVNNTAQAEIRMSLHGQSIENVLHFVNADGWSFQELSLLASDLVSWWTSDLAPLLSFELSLREVYVRDLSAQAALEASSAPSTQATGGVNNESLPANIALCVSLRTGFAGRSYRGRSYVPGIPENQSQYSVFTGSFVTAVVNAYNILRADSIAGGYPLVVVSRRVGGVARDVGVATPVTAVIAVDTAVDSQRRRLPGRGK